MTMRKNKLMYIALLLLPGFVSCADNGNDNRDIDNEDGQVRLRANVAKSNVLTRGDDNLESATDGDYYLHYTKVRETELTENKFTLSGGNGTTWTAYPTLYWDDIKEATPKEKTKFYLTNMNAMTFSTKAVNEDILFGETTGWNTPLNFTLNHLTSKITVIVYDNTLNRTVGFNNAKVMFYPGLNRTTAGINYGSSTIESDLADKDKTTAINRSDLENTEITVNSKECPAVKTREGSELYIVPQEFTGKDSLEITTEEYVYRIPVPLPILPGDTEAKDPFSLEAGQHLTIQVELREDYVNATAKLTNWGVEEVEKPIEISRVFNIASWNELRDLAQAIATGYTFKGMVVRLTADVIELKDQISLGTEEHPFEGVFDGIKCQIKGLGVKDDVRRNKGGLFAYTRGATIQNVTLVAPYVESDGKNPVGSLIDNAESTTVFNCKTASNAAGEAGDVNGGTANKVGGLIGTTTGTSTLINCYSFVRVEGKGEYIGGLIGHAQASITHCFAKGEVDCISGIYVGGLAGFMAGSMKYCFAQGKVTGSKIGGLIGELDGKVSQCYSSGTLTGTEKGGLFCSLGFDAAAEYCFWLGVGTNGVAPPATLPENCKGYAIGSDLLTDNGVYLDNTGDVWNPTVEANSFPEFANQ